MNGAVLCCWFCGTALRHNDNTMCGCCARAAGFQNSIPDGFYDSGPLRDALARYDFGSVFIAVREHTGLSQAQLGNLLGLSQGRVSNVEGGTRRLTHVNVVARLAAVLRIPSHLLGFPADPAGTVVAEEEVNWLQRRDFLAFVTAAALGSSLHPGLARLHRLVPGHSTPVTRPQIGTADVKAIETITDAFRRTDFAHGGGLCRAAAVAQLQQVRQLQDAICTTEIRTRLLLATAELASITAWMAYDVDDHEAARRLWIYALDTSRRAEDHPRSSDLAVDLLLDMAHQALHLERPGEALRLTQLAASTSVNRKHPVSIITEGYIAAVLAWCRAALGEPEATLRALGQAEDTYSAADPATAPPWAWFVTPAEITAQQGHSLYLLSRTRPEFAPAAIDKLTAAADGYGRGYERSRAVLLPPLASARFQASDIDTAVATGYEAVSAIAGLSSTRGYARLHVLSELAEPHKRRSEVAELRDHIRTAIATST